MAFEWKAATFFDALHWRRPHSFSLEWPILQAPAIPDVQSEGEADLEADSSSSTGHWQVDFTSPATANLQSLPEMIEAWR